MQYCSELHFKADMFALLKWPKHAGSCHFIGFPCADTIQRKGILVWTYENKQWHGVCLWGDGGGTFLWHSFTTGDEVCLCLTASNLPPEVQTPASCHILSFVSCITLWDCLCLPWCVCHGSCARLGCFRKIICFGIVFLLSVSERAQPVSQSDILWHSQEMPLVRVAFVMVIGWTCHERNVEVTITNLDTVI